MSYITEIDVERINSFNKMSTDNGKGVQIRDALTVSAPTDLNVMTTVQHRKS